MPSELSSLSITEALDGLKNHQFSIRDLITALQDRIAVYNPKLNAYLTVNNQLVDQEIIPGLLSGIPLAIKDNFLISGMRTTASSRVLDNYIAHYDSTVTSRLKNAGALFLGKTNLDAWAHGSSTETSDFGTTRNPWNTDYSPGGSSGGSAAAVAADLCLGAIGSETAGSIRIPAAWCGVVGLKPSYGRVSRYGIIAMASSTDSPGPITKTVSDSALLLDVIAGHDPYDATSSSLPVADYLANLNIPRKFTLGVSDEYLAKILDRPSQTNFQKSLDIFKKIGFKIKKIKLLDPKYSIGVYTIVQRSEVSSNLARYDGIRYGRDRTFFGEEAKRRIMLGTYALSSGYYDQYYRKAQQVRAVIISDFQKAFSEVDLILAPESPGPAPKVGSSASSPMYGEMVDELVEPSSIAGLCGISLPNGYSSDLPTAFQLIGPQFHETELLQAAFTYEKEYNWRTKKPLL